MRDEAFIPFRWFCRGQETRGPTTLEGNLGRLQRLVGRVWGEVKGPLYRNAIFLMISSVIGSGLGFFFWVIVYRVYTNPDDAGYAVTLVNTISFLAGIASFGLPIGLIRFLPESDDKVPIVNTALSIAGLASLILTTAFMLGVNVWAPQLNFIVARPEYVLILLVTAMAYAFAPVLDQTMIALRRADLFTWRVLILAVLKIPLPLVFVTWFSESLGGRLGIYFSFSVAFGVSVLVAGFVFLPWIIPRFRPRPRMSLRRIRPMFTFSFGNWVSGVIGTAGSLLLPLLILNTLGPQGAGNAAVYYAAAVIAGMLYIIPQATMTSFFAEASQRNAQRRRDERKAVVLSLGLLTPGIVAMWVFAVPLLGLFDLKRYQDIGVGPLRILSLGAIPVFLNSVLGTRLRVRKQVRPIIVSTVITTSVTLILGYGLLTWLGLDGLAMAVVLGHVASTPYLVFVAGEPMEVEPIEPAPAPP